MNVDELNRLPIAWEPDPAAFPGTPLGRMAARHGLTSVDEVADRAAADPGWFWAAAADDVGLRWRRPYEKVLDLSDGPEFPHWFKGGGLNWADYAVDRWVDEGRAGAEAIVWEGDDGAVRTLTYGELKEQIDRAAGAFAARGVGVGDVVALFLPMVPEAAVVMLAAAKIGAVVAPFFSGFGPGPVRERLLDSGAKLMVTADGFERRGKLVPLKETADEAAADAPGLRTVLVVRRLGRDIPLVPGRDEWWDEATAAAEPMTETPVFDAETPCVLLYSSGSTGRPKGCLHTHAGLPFKFAQEARHGFGMDVGERLMWVTDMGWVMGAYVVTAAFTNGGTAVLYEGTPDHPTPDRLWSVVERHRVTALGVSPTLIRVLAGLGDRWPDAHALPDLRVICSTGEPWNLEPWWWCFRHVGKGRTPIVNMSGGTECGASIVSGSVHRPIKPAGFSAPSLGMAADVFDPDGRPVRGQVGELVVRAPWPGMTKGLWDGPERYLSTYWSRFPGNWQQGDFAYVDPDGHWFLLGRSDDTIMLAGKRVGPAEIESLLVDDPAVVEAAAVGVPDDLKGEALVCFVVLTGDADPAEVLPRLEESIVAREGKATRPKAVHAVAALPKTRNGKVMRRVARAVYIGADPGDVTALESREPLTGFPRRDSV
ncbi:AMP-binding protein [Nonomuraea harbinensis]|uniref:AMP-binding protein n=1 Tax=Nonomuraea harbinensis TaxID=1286938 RepID=A0ABW1BZ65_9ACTN|nr:AMP-binding protein [Nonomuraea harbinensis]